MPLALRGRVGWDSALGKITNIITNNIVLPSAMIPVMTIPATLCNMFQGPYAWPVPNARQLNSVPTKPSSSMIWTKLLSASHAIQIKRLVNGRAHAIPRGIFARLINWAIMNGKNLSKPSHAKVVKEYLLWRMSNWLPTIERGPCVSPSLYYHPNLIY